jgi:hypothetical protein
MTNHGGRRSRGQPAHLHETIQVYLAMQRATTEAEFAELLGEHDRLTDADGLPRLRQRTLEEFRRGSGLTISGRISCIKRQGPPPDGSGPRVSSRPRS